MFLPRNMPAACTAVIFDMDGVLIDSEIFWDEAGHKFFNKRGITFTREIKAHLTGNSMQQAITWVKQEFSLPEPVADLCDEYTALSSHIYEHVTQPLPGAVELLAALRAANIKTAIASGSYLARIELVVKKFGWEKYFDALVSADQVNFVGKPHPAIYERAASELQVAPAACVAIEDSVNGLWSAKAAGMRCIAAVNERWSFGDFSQADLIVPSLADERIYTLLGLTQYAHA